MMPASDAPEILPPTIVTFLQTGEEVGRDEGEGGSEGAAGGDEDGGGVLSAHTKKLQA